MGQLSPTRQRLLDEGLRLFAEVGFRATAVGAIEAAAGLQPRRGALYKHFPSKRALLEAAVQFHLDNAATGASLITEQALTALGGDRLQLRPVVVEFGRWFLAEMDRLKDLTRVLEHDGQRVSELTEAVRTSMVDLSYRTAADLIVALGSGVEDPDAAAVILLGSLVALRRTAWTFGAAPLGIDDARALSAWADSTLATLRLPE